MTEVEFERLLFLKGNSLFQGLDFPFLVALAPMFSWRNFQSGAIVFDPDVDRPPLLLIKEGSIIEKNGREYKNTVGLNYLAGLHFRKKGGEEVLVAGADGCRLLQADGRAFFDLIQEMPEIALWMLSVEEN